MKQRMKMKDKEPSSIRPNFPEAQTATLSFCSLPFLSISHSGLAHTFHSPSFFPIFPSSFFTPVFSFQVTARTPKANLLLLPISAAHSPLLLLHVLQLSYTITAPFNLYFLSLHPMSIQDKLSSISAITTLRARALILD